MCVCVCGCNRKEKRRNDIADNDDDDGLYKVCIGMRTPHLLKPKWARSLSRSLSLSAFIARVPYVCVWVLFFLSFHCILTAIAVCLMCERRSVFSVLPKSCFYSYYMEPGFIGVSFSYILNGLNVCCCRLLGLYDLLFCLFSFVRFVSYDSISMPHFFFSTQYFQSVSIFSIKADRIQMKWNAKPFGNLIQTKAPLLLKRFNENHHKAYEICWCTNFRKPKWILPCVRFVLRSNISFIFYLIHRIPFISFCYSNE